MDAFTGIIRLLSIPVTFIYDSLVNILYFTWSIVWPERRRQIDNPASDVSNFIAKFKEKYGTNHPAFFQGTYNQALLEAKKNLTFLVVYLHSEHNQDTDEFCSDVLTHPEVVSYIQRNNILFWGCPISAAEGYRVSVALKGFTYPFLGLIGLKENHRMVLVRKFEGSTTVERLLSQLQQGIDENEAAFVVARLDKQERDMNQLIRTEQDEAYQESLKADQEKERKRKEEQEKKDVEDRARREKEEQELKKRDDLIRMKIELADRIPAEPDSSASNTIRVLVKLPNGVRLERRFLRTSSIKYLIYYVFCHDQSPVSFQVTTNFPRKELPCKPPTVENPECKVKDESGNWKDPITFEELGFGSSEMLFVHDLEA
ncbi:FAS-associated factor 2-B [Halotydeus destructor]|nr:FAS-associated factor 2-B [Halotydeus destructor]